MAYSGRWRSPTMGPDLGSSRFMGAVDGSGHGASPCTSRSVNRHSARMGGLSWKRELSLYPAFVSKRCEGSDVTAASLKSAGIWVGRSRRSSLKAGLVLDSPFTDLRVTTLLKRCCGRYPVRESSHERLEVLAEELVHEHTAGSHPPYAGAQGLAGDALSRGAFWPPRGEL